MADEINRRDDNRITVSSAVTDDSDKFIVQLRVDPVTKRLKVDQEALVAGVDTVNIADSSNNTINPATSDNQTNGEQKTQIVDHVNRESLNTVFGEKITGRRIPTEAAQFQYGYPLSRVNLASNGSGTYGFSDSMAYVSTGTDSDGSASFSSKKAIHYIPGHEAYLLATAVFTTPKADSYQRAGMFNSVDGFFLGYEGTDFKVTRRRDSTDYSTTITLNDVFTGFDPTKGNVYRITFGYLGFATINFEVMKPDGSWASLHKIEYPNSSAVTHITNTCLQPRIEVSNDGNTSDLKVYSGSVTVGIVDGSNSDPGARYFAFSALEQTIVAGTYTYITFRSKESFNSLVNYITSKLMLLSFNTDLSKSSSWSLIRNMTITNTPTWTDVNTSDSVMEYSTDATVTQGTGIVDLALPLGKVDRVLITDLENQQIELLPGETMTLVITTPVGTSDTFDLAFRWKELF